MSPRAIGFCAFLIGLVASHAFEAWPLNSAIDPELPPSRAIGKLRAGSTLFFGFGVVYFVLGSKAEEWFGHPTAMNRWSLLFIVPLGVLAFVQ